MEKYQAINKKVDSILDTIRGKERKLIDIKNNEPSNKRVKKQFRLITKKSSRQPQVLNMTTKNEKIEIKRFSNSFAERKTLHVHNDNDICIMMNYKFINMNDIINIIHI